MTAKQRNEDIIVNLNFQSQVMTPWADHTVDPEFLNYKYGEQQCFYHKITMWIKFKNSRNVPGKL